MLLLFLLQLHEHYFNVWRNLVTGFLNCDWKVSSVSMADQRQIHSFFYTFYTSYIPCSGYHCMKLVLCPLPVHNPINNHLKGKHCWLVKPSDCVMYRGFIPDVLFTKGVFGCQGKTAREKSTHLRAFTQNHKGRRDVLTLIKLLVLTQSTRCSFAALSFKM